MPQCFLRGHWHTVDSGDVIGFGTIQFKPGLAPQRTQLAQTGLHLRTMDKAAIGDQRQLQRRLRRLLPQYLSDASHRIGKFRRTGRFAVAGKRNVDQSARFWRHRTLHEIAV